MAANEQFLIRILAQDSTRRAFQSVHKGLGGISTAAASFRLGATAAFAAVAGGAVVLNKELLRTKLQFEAIDKTLAFATGGVAKGAEAFAFATEQSRRLGQDVAVTAQAFAQFAAAAKGTALEGQAAADIFTAVSEAAAVLQLDSYSTRGALRALEQMISKGNVQAEELRQQLGERLPGAFQMAAQAMGVTTAELNDMLENGEVLAEDLLPKLARVLRSRFGPDLPKAVNSLNASVGRLNTEWSLFKKNLADNMPYKEAIDALQTLLRLSNDMVDAARQPIDVTVGGEADQALADLQARLKEAQESLANARKEAENPGFKIALLDLFSVDQVAQYTMQVNTLSFELEKLYKKIAEGVDAVIPESGPFDFEEMDEFFDALSGNLNQASLALAGIDLTNVIPKDVDFREPLDGFNELLKEQDQVFKALERTINKSLSPTEKYAKTVREFVENALRLEQIDPEAFAQLGGMEAIQEAVKGLAEGFKGDTEEEGPFKNLIGEMDIVFNRWDEGLDGMADAFAQTIQRMAIEFLTSRLVDALSGGFSGMGEGGGGFLAGFTKGLTGKAVGGTIMANRPYLVGEKGPELLYAGRSGTIVPNDQMGGGGLNYAPVVNISGGASEQDRALFSAELRRQKAEIADMLARRRF